MERKFFFEKKTSFSCKSSGILNVTFFMLKISYFSPEKTRNLKKKYLT